MGFGLGAVGEKGLLFLALSVGLGACGGRPSEEASALKIRQGFEVSREASGPERVSTVGLKGFAGGGSYTCSAALIGSRYLLTAAHCVASRTIYAFFGVNMLDPAEDEGYLQVSHAVVHPDYDADLEGLPPHDIALLKLSQDVPSGYTPRGLAEDVGLEKDEQVLLAGFGRTEDGTGSDVLRYVESTYVGEDDDGRLVLID